MCLGRCFIVLSISVLVGASCRSPSAGYRPLSQTGTTRIPPPPTGAFGVADSATAGPSQPVVVPPGGQAATALPQSVDSSAVGTVAPTHDRAQGEHGRSAARPDRVITQYSRPAEQLDEPRKWVEPVNPVRRAGEDTLPGSARRNTPVLAPSPAIREPTPQAGGKTVIRLSYEQPTEDRTATQILSPTSPWTNRPSPSNSAR